MNSARELRRSLQSLGIHKYAAASLLNTITGIGIIAALFHLTHNPYITIFMSAMLGYGYSLITYHFIAFAGKGLKLPYARYAIIYASSYVLNTFLTRMLMASYDNFLYTQVVAIPVVAIVQWIMARLWGFRKNIDSSRNS